MRLLVCTRNIGNILQVGDLISWHLDEVELGQLESLHKALMFNRYKQNQIDNFFLEQPFALLNLPLITYEDIRPIIEDVTVLGEDGAEGNIRKWKLGWENLEQRAIGFFDSNDLSSDKLYWEQVISGQIRRDTLVAYREITRPDITIDQILVAR